MSLEIPDVLVVVEGEIADRVVNLRRGVHGRVSSVRQANQINAVFFAASLKLMKLVVAQSIKLR
jgi:hypothetical protein